MFRFFVFPFFYCICKFGVERLVRELIYFFSVISANASSIGVPTGLHWFLPEKERIERQEQGKNYAKELKTARIAYKMEHKKERIA